MCEKRNKSLRGLRCSFKNEGNTDTNGRDPELILELKGVYISEERYPAL